MFNAVACSAGWGLVASIEIEVRVKRRFPLVPWGRTFSSIKDNVKMASRGRNM